MISLRALGATLLAALAGIASPGLTSPICTMISDSSRGESEILYNYFSTFINGTDPFSVIAHDSVETQYNSFADPITNDASIFRRHVHQVNPRYYRTESYTRRSSAYGGYNQSLRVTVCAPASDLIYRGAQNTASRDRIAYGNHLMGNYKNNGWWHFEFSLKYWAGEQPICNVNFGKGKLPALFECPVFTFNGLSAINEDPEVRTEAQELRERLDVLIENATRVNQDYKREAEEMDSILKSIEEKALNEITTADLGHIQDLTSKVQTLNEKVNALLDEKDRLKNEFETAWLEANMEIDKVVSQHNIVLSDYDTSFAFKIADSVIDLEQLAADSDASARVYRQYAQETIRSLKQINSQDDSIGFLTQAKLWLDTAASLESILTSKDISSPAEWRALNASFEEVETYIFRIVDKDFWFRDSALTYEQKRAIDSIKNVNPFIGSTMERDLRSYRAANMTPEKHEILQLLEAVGGGIAESGANDTDAAQYTPLLTQLASAVAEGAVCAAKVVAYGDFGDFYEVVIGKDICTGEVLSTSERLISSLSLVVGTARFWRGVGRATGLSQSARTITKISSEIREKGRAMGMTDDQLESFARRAARLDPCNNR